MTIQAHPRLAHSFSFDNLLSWQCRGSVVVLHVLVGLQVFRAAARLTGEDTEQLDARTTEQLQKMQGACRHAKLHLLCDDAAHIVETMTKVARAVRVQLEREHANRMAEQAVDRELHAKKERRKSVAAEMAKEVEVLNARRASEAVAAEAEGGGVSGGIARVTAPAGATWLKARARLNVARALGAAAAQSSSGTVDVDVDVDVDDEEGAQVDATVAEAVDVAIAEEGDGAADGAADGGSDALASAAAVLAASETSVAPAAAEPPALQELEA